MKEIKDYTDEELTAEHRSLECMIYDMDCYGMSDMRMLMAVEAELDRRGYEKHSASRWTKTPLDSEDDEG